MTRSTKAGKESAKLVGMGGAAGGRPLVGVIRYNQSYNPADADLKTLSPKKWHDRIPWYLKVTADGVSGTCDSQEIFDRDLQYAGEAGIDFFAHLNQQKGAVMGKAVEYHMASRCRSRGKFCVIVHFWSGQLEAESWEERVERLVGYFRHESYQTVLNGRPLVFIFSPNRLKEAFGDKARAHIDAIREKARAAGLAEPYIASMYWGNQAKEIGDLGLDCFSAYMFAAAGGENRKGYPFSRTMEANIRSWDNDTGGVDVIPNVTLGNDQRPRWEIPPPWGAFENPWFEQPTTDEMAAFVKRAAEWVESHPDRARARALVVYAWDEVAEGGWLVPTHTEGDRRLQALKRVLG